MNNFKEEILTSFQKRMKKSDKKIFLNYLKEKIGFLGYNYVEEKNNLCTNIYVGNINKAKYIIGAHYDTPPRMPGIFMKNQLLLNIFINIFLLLIFTDYWFLGLLITVFLYLYLLGFLGFSNKNNYNDNSSGIIGLLTLMEKLENKDDYLFVFFDNEEKGLIGSLVFNKKHNLNDKKIIILDCIANGDNINIYNSKKNISLFQKELMLCYNISCVNVFKKNMFKSSDHLSFKNSESVLIICEIKKKKKMILPFIHTKKDLIFNNEIFNKTINGIMEYLK